MGVAERSVRAAARVPSCLSLPRLLVAANVEGLVIRREVTLSGIVVPISLADGFRLADRVRAVAEWLRGGKPAAADGRGFPAHGDRIGRAAKALDEPGHDRFLLFCSVGESGVTPRCTLAAPASLPRFH